MTQSAGVVYRGLFPVAPTPFNDSGDLELDGQRRVLDCMFDQRVDGILYPRKLLGTISSV